MPRKISSSTSQNRTDELWDTYPDLTQTQIRSALALFLFKGDDVGKRVASLSGGERARLTLIKLMLSKMNLLILDEPTNHLDINSREALESALEDFDGTIIAVSHDRYFMKKLATRILDFGVPEPPIYDFRGGWEEYREYKTSIFRRRASALHRNCFLPKEEYLRQSKGSLSCANTAPPQTECAEETQQIEERLTDISEEMHGEAATDHAACRAVRGAAGA